MSESALDLLMNHDFPGNVRELENIIISAVSLAGKEHVLTKEHIKINKINVRGNEKKLTDDIKMEDGLDSLLENIEKNLIKEAMLTSDGNITKAAEKLKIKRQTLQHKLKKQL